MGNAYVDSGAAAVLPLFIGYGLSGDPLNVSVAVHAAYRRARDLEKFLEVVLTVLWMVTVFLAVGVCIAVTRPVQGTTTTIQAAVQGEDVKGAGFCGNISCVLPPMRFIKASGALTQYYYCGNDKEDPDVPCGGQGATVGVANMVVEMGDSDADGSSSDSSIIISRSRVKSLRLRVQTIHVEFVEWILGVDVLIPTNVNFITKFDLNEDDFGENFSFAVVRFGALLSDVWIIRCNDLVLVAFVAGGSVEVVEPLRPPRERSARLSAEWMLNTP